MASSGGREKEGGAGPEVLPPGSPVPAGGPAEEARDRRVAAISARELLGPRGVVHIDHEGEIYTLRLTRNNRLILTK